MMTRRLVRHRQPREARGDVLPLPAAIEQKQWEQLQEHMFGDGTSGR
jgi:hypothetical protein